MPRCKALAAGGSRRCRRNALKGQEFCSFHGGSHSSPSSRKSRSSSRSSTTSGPTVPSRTRTQPSYPGSPTRRVVNPAFKQVSLDNPVFQHFLHDKIGDAERAFLITSGVSVATAPWLTKVRFSSPQGFLASSAVVALIAAPMIAYSNTADTYRDLVQFAHSGELHGTKLMGESHH